MAGIPTKKERTRATLLESAYALFMERGFEAVSIHEIAARAGVSRTTFFNYFASKEAALRDIANHWYREHARTLQPLRPHQPALAVLRENFFARIAMLPDHRPFIALMLDHSPALDIRENILLHGEEPADENLRELLALFRLAQAQGELKPGVSAEAALQVYIALRNLVIHAWAANPAMGAGDLQAQAMQMLGILMQGCAVQPRANARAAMA